MSRYGGAWAGRVAGWAVLAMWLLAAVGLGLVLAVTTPARAQPAVAGAARATARAAVPATAPPRVLRVPVTGVIDPLLSSGVAGAIRGAAQHGDSLVLLELDTPGGLDSAMREIIRAILDAPVPVVADVTPEGARAASAGTFIVAASSYAVMAPGTNLGAAHPVGVPQGSVESEKVTNDAAAYIRSLAEHRGRSRQAVTWYENAVRQAVAADANQARQLGVVDAVVADEATVLRQLDGRALPDGAGRPVTVHTAGAQLHTFRLGPAAALLHGLIDPDIAYLLFILGIAGLVYEVVHPGIGVGGVGGGLALILALLEFQLLPVRLGAVVLLVVGVALFLLDLKLGGHAFLWVFGVVFLVLGGLLLYQPSSGMRVHPLVLAAVVALVCFLFLVVARSVLAARRTPPITGVDALVGQHGSVLTALSPEGRVRAGGLDWRARAAAGVPLPVPPGSEVVVAAVDGLTVEVLPLSIATTATAELPPAATVTPPERPAPPAPPG